MFKIVAASIASVNSLLLLKLNCSKPRQQHLMNLIEALLAYEGSKTIAILALERRLPFCSYLDNKGPAQADHRFTHSQRPFFLHGIDFRRNEDSCSNVQFDAPAPPQRRSIPNPHGNPVFIGRNRRLATPTAKAQA